ncbi:uncharacterized protein LOC129906223 [Episyrphus balteatus]|uniref:uncharacterized protein LOC129906223 n=1 Tax=Episyrphus balteatus TaxID=286459 RepID=UPI0024858423|nr:uncharacterized protein LOC129906223 [Episyrphus balteatus]
MSLLKVNYYDHPEGQDAVGKIIALNRYAVSIGLAYSTIDVLMVSKPQGYLATLGRYAYNTGPLVGMASAFTLGCYAANNLRGVDDKWNYTIGGLMAGAVYGSWKRTVPGGIFMGVVFSLAGFLKKLSIEEGWEFFPERQTHELGSLHGVNHDYTLMAERPKNWTTGKD